MPATYISQGKAKVSWRRFPRLRRADARTTFTYTYNTEHELTSYTGAGGNEAYAYDDTHQLTGATGDRTESYAFDPNGNRTASHLHGTAYVTGTNNQLLSDGQFNFTYDTEGNRHTKTEIATGNVTTYGWDHRNRLISVITVDSMANVLMEAHFTYDVFNNLIIRDVDADGAGAGTAVVMSTVYNGIHPWADFNAAGQLLHHYLYGEAVDELLGRIDAEGVIDWYLTDNLGSVRDIVDSTGNILDALNYDTTGATGLARPLLVGVRRMSPSRSMVDDLRVGGGDEGLLFEH